MLPGPQKQWGGVMGIACVRGGGGKAHSYLFTHRETEAQHLKDMPTVTQVTSVLKKKAFLPFKILFLT